MRSHSWKDVGSTRYTIGNNIDGYGISSDISNRLAQGRDSGYDAIKGLEGIGIQREPSNIADNDRADGGCINVDLHLHLREIHELYERRAWHATNRAIDGGDCSIVRCFEHSIVQIILRARQLGLGGVQGRLRRIDRTLRGSALHLLLTQGARQLLSGSIDIGLGGTQ